ncbi:MAG TPA: potassium transporter TrkA [Sulfurimonas sp. UBA12504]|nr:MAG: potassium transporter TrkA [Sulfurimonas sp. GWF2_37_8]DAB30930.1 MAG TPA: potassium transporter TrkA [Sulfurimonas sp. UBA12504]
MMKTRSALIFGYNEFALEIADNIAHKYENITIFKFDDESKKRNGEKYSVASFDLSDNWDVLEKKFDMENSVIFCALLDDATNIFLTISLRASFANVSIISLAKDKESANKLTMAGASKVIPIVQTTASIISDMLKKPIVTEVLHNILYEKSNLKIAQVCVEQDTFFAGKHPYEVDWKNIYKIIVLFVLHEDMSSEFIYSSKASHHSIKNGDKLVVVGYEEDIKLFEQNVGSRYE